jgi:hypothetical protein
MYVDLPTGSLNVVDLTANVHSLVNVGIMVDSFSNRILNNFPNAGHSVVSADFLLFQGPISEFTFTVWLAPSTSGYIYILPTLALQMQWRDTSLSTTLYNNNDDQIVMTVSGLFRSQSPSLYHLSAVIFSKQQQLPPYHDSICIAEFVVYH